MEVLFPRKMQWLEKTNEFLIHWGEDHISTFPLNYLRKTCPCALCRTEREQEKNPLQLLKKESTFIAKNIEPVGNYAVKITWADGHSSGIYSYELLKELCPCPLCK